jgi:hypothetical protein
LSGSQASPLPESFSFAEHHGEVDRRWRIVDLEAELPRLVDPGAAERTLHWGRNYLYSLHVQTAEGPLAVVVKQFRNEGRRERRRRRRGWGKAERSWRAIRELETAGIPTPEPVIWIESARPGGPSYLVTRRIEGSFESRHLFRALRDGWHGRLFRGAEVEAVIREMGLLIRRMHAAGIWHRDVTMGNLLVSVPDEGPQRPELRIIDLNRARLGVPLTLWRRLKDLWRLPVLGREYRRMFLDAYWGEGSTRRWLKDALFVVGARSFLFKNRAKSTFRAPFRILRRWVASSRPHPHIPPAPEGARPRDKAVWDHLSDQPHQHAGRLERMRVRLTDSVAHGKATAVGLGALPRVIQREKELFAGLYTGPVPFGGVGVAIQPRPQHAEAQLEALEELGARSVLLRLYAWEEDHKAEESLARELAARGIEIAFVLAQSRALVRDRVRWHDAVNELADRFLPFGRTFQIGQAINRSKWGVWNHGEYLGLAETACELLRGRGDVTLLGPPIIDFELHAYLGLLNLRRPAVYFDAVAAQLYVDRRGAPENKQLGYDTVGKVVVVKAIADGSGLCGDGLWITEFNWPLWEGPHSPAGRDVAVDEERQADFLARYYLLTLGTGLVQRAYWWQLVARGYGLLDPKGDGGLRRRPAFRAMAQLVRALAGSTFDGPLEATYQARLYRFTDRAGRDLVVGWTPGLPAERTLPAPATECLDRQGNSVRLRDPHRVELGPSPRYYYL